MLLLLAEPEERLHRAAGVRALHPLGLRAPLELRTGRRVGQRGAGPQQEGDVHAVVDRGLLGGGHVMLLLDVTIWVSCSGCHGCSSRERVMKTARVQRSCRTEEQAQRRSVHAQVRTSPLSTCRRRTRRGRQPCARSYHPAAPCQAAARSGHGLSGAPTAEDAEADVEPARPRTCSTSCPAARGSVLGDLPPETFDVADSAERPVHPARVTGENANACATSTINAIKRKRRPHDQSPRRAVARIISTDTTHYCVHHEAARSW